MNPCRTFESILLCVGLTLPLSSYGFFYRAEAIEGWVVDAQSGKPVEAVVVVAHWRLTGGFEGGTPVAELKILETTTDINGRYSFPAWGPKFASSGLFGSLKSESPEILMFKKGYKFQRLVNYSYRDTSRSEWNKERIKLEPFAGTLAQYAEALASLSSALWITGWEVGDHWGSHCGWESFPRMLKALDQLEAEFRAAGVKQGTVVSDLKANGTRLTNKGCASLLEVLNARAR